MNRRLLYSRFSQSKGIEQNFRVRLSTVIERNRTQKIPWQSNAIKDLKRPSHVRLPNDCLLCGRFSSISELHLVVRLCLVSLIALHWFGNRTHRSHFSTFDCVRLMNSIELNQRIEFDCGYTYSSTVDQLQGEVCNEKDNGNVTGKGYSE